jgi:2-hydroxychromene-2-carboxylate isomerase
MMPPSVGSLGPAEIPEKRRYLYLDVMRSARSLGLPPPLCPPEHPFSALKALRTVTLFQDSPQALQLAERIASAAWTDGHSIDDLTVLSDCVRSCGLDSAGLTERIASSEAKALLRSNTETAITAGVFGVPSFVTAAGEVFWGADRMDVLGQRLAWDDHDRGDGGLDTYDSDLRAAEEVLKRPQNKRPTRPKL